MFDPCGKILRTWPSPLHSVKIFDRGWRRCGPGDERAAAREGGPAGPAKSIKVNNRGSGAMPSDRYPGDDSTLRRNGAGVGFPVDGCDGSGGGGFRGAGMRIVPSRVWHFVVFDCARVRVDVIPGGRTRPSCRCGRRIAWRRSMPSPAGDGYMESRSEIDQVQ